MVSGFDRLVRVHRTAHARPKAEAAGSGAAISLRGIGFSYTKRPFIEDFSLDFARGAITTLVGPNGCGKSTLLKIVDGLLYPTAGEVLLDGRDCLSMNARERAQNLALLPQGSRPPTMSVEALVACGRYPYQRGLLASMEAQDKRRIEEAMELAGVRRFRDHDVRLLSGGERQRAFIAMILAQDTEIICLDEPTTYLDVNACHEIMQLTRELGESAGKTIIMVNHDIDLALRYSDRLAVMTDGALLATGEVADVLASGALEEAFQVEVRQWLSDDRPAYTVFPR